MRRRRSTIPLSPTDNFKAPIADITGVHEGNATVGMRVARGWEMNMSEEEYERAREERDELVELGKRANGRLREKVMKRLEEVRGKLKEAHRTIYEQQRTTK